MEGTADLVAEDAEATEPTRTDGAFGDDAPSFAMVVGDRCHLDGVSAVGPGDFEG